MLVSSRKICAIWLLEIRFIGKSCTRKAPPTGSIIKFLLQIYNNNQVIFKRFFIVDTLKLHNIEYK